MPLAARVSDMHSCPMQTPGTPPVAHVGGAITGGESNVLIGKMQAATVGSSCFCVGAQDSVTQGSNSVFINKKPAARAGDPTAHGGIVTSGFSTVLIGD